MPILEKVCISLYLGLIGPYLVPIGLYLVPIGPYLVPIGPYLIPVGPYLTLLSLIWPYWALTVKQKRNTEGPHRGHRVKGHLNDLTLRRQAGAWRDRYLKSLPE